MQKYLDALRRLFTFFKRDPEDDRKWTEKLRDKYRLVLMHDETFEEVSSFKLTPLNVYVLVSSMVVGTAAIVTLLIVYTPLKRYIPGYGDYRRDNEMAMLNTKVNNLESEIEASRLYQENMRKILTGNLEDMTREATEEQHKSDQPTDSLEPQNVGRIPEDKQLRDAVTSGSFSKATAPAVATVTGNLGFRDVPLEQIFFMPAVSGDVTAKYDPSKDHLGIDIAAPRNTAIKAAADGTVISAGYTVETGYSIAIQHPNNVVTMYKHNSILLKKAGSTVKAGEAIAIIGNTGELTSGPHLHFELWYKGRPANPTDYINFK
jgi:murein DD-endopeptidase MepM/ murein hydrolase activator NlpD